MVKLLSFPHTGFLVSFVIKSLVPRPRGKKRAKHPWGAPSSGGDLANFVLFPLIPLLSFSTPCLCLFLALPLLSLFLLPVPCLESQQSWGHPLWEHCRSVHRRCRRLFSSFHCNLKKNNSGSHSIINAYEH